MKIQLNGEPRQVEDQLTAAQLIEMLGLGEQRLAIEINREIVPRSQFPVHSLQPGDQVEIVHAIGGG